MESLWNYLNPLRLYPFPFSFCFIVVFEHHLVVWVFLLLLYFSDTLYPFFLSPFPFGQYRFSLFFPLFPPSLFLSPSSLRYIFMYIYIFFNINIHMYISLAGLSRRNFVARFSFNTKHKNHRRHRRRHRVVLFQR